MATLYLHSDWYSNYAPTLNDIRNKYVGAMQSFLFSLNVLRQVCPRMFVHVLYSPEADGATDSALSGHTIAFRFPMDTVQVRPGPAAFCYKPN